MIPRKSPLVCYTGYYVSGGSTIEIPYAEFVYRKDSLNSAEKKKAKIGLPNYFRCLKESSLPNHNFFIIWHNRKLLV